MSASRVLGQRLKSRNLDRLDVVTVLEHFALVTYALPRDRLLQHVPDERYEIEEFDIEGRRFALMSAVPFLDRDFRFPRLAPFARFQFGQTNYRVYVRDRRTQEPAVWFFGTTLGSWVVNIPRWLWRIPWHYGQYDCDCSYAPNDKRYRIFKYRVESDWAAAEIDLLDTGKPVSLQAGFNAIDEQTLILTHPLDGYFYRLDGRLGHYSVWHETMQMTAGEPRHLYFGLFERLGLLSRSEMERPHSIFICPRIEFKVFLPPQEVK